MFQVIPFEEKYLSNWQYDGSELKLTLDYDVKEIARTYNLLGEAFMGFIDSKLVALGGIYKVFFGIGQAWLFLNKIDSHQKDLFQAIQRHLKEIIEKEKYHKVQIYCLKDSFKINNLAEHLKFRKVTDLTLYEIKGE